MTLKDRIREALPAAIKRQDKAQSATLRLLLSEIKNAEIAEQKPADDVKVAEIINRQVRRHRESIEIFKQASRDDLVTQEETELRILMNFLPQQMSHDEIIAAARRVIDLVGAKSPSDKGKVMSQLMPQVRGKVGGKEVSDTVSQLLATI
ncbi:MAG: GatB/YqeY domain-containing protein [Chloroflexota bacterium]|nr:GatB/YqeY domain-containing protein [Chloroflexota bacterium]